MPVNVPLLDIFHFHKYFCNRMPSHWSRAGSYSSLVCLFVPMPKWPCTQEIVVHCILVIKAIGSMAGATA